jgi:YtoQ family protein
MSESPAAWRVHLAGEIHTDWRDEIRAGCEAAAVPALFTAQVTDHAASDDCAENILGPQPPGFWNDHASAKINAIRTRTAIEKADLVVVRFGEQYKQWNAAFDAGYAAALGKPLVVLHPEGFTHALKEVDAAAMAVCQTSSEVVELLKYVITQR